jgi:hypothetical protein
MELRRLSDEVDDLISSEDMEMIVALGARRTRISMNREVPPSAIKKMRPRLRGAAAETVLRQMRSRRHGRHSPRY